MTGEQRRGLIRRQAIANGGVTVADLQELLEVSPMTIWRDIGALERSGDLKRVHGGAVPARGDLGPEAGFSVKACQNAAAKSKLAALVVDRFVKPSMVLAMEGGTTVAAMMPLLPTDANLTILTNSLEVVRQAPSGVSVYCSGGLYRNVSGTFVGPQATRFFRDYRADLAFVSSTGIDPEAGLMDPNPLEIEVKRELCRVSKLVIALLDGSKWEKGSLSPAIPLADIDLIVSDVAPPEPFPSAIREAGTDFQLVG